MKADVLEERVFERAKEFGLISQNEETTHKKRNAIIRSNLKSYNDPNPRCYFGYIRPEEAPSQEYSDLSFVIFPQKDEGKCVVSIGVGSAGFQRDYDLVSNPGTRRLFTRLTKPDGNSFIKNDFTDIENPQQELQDKIDSEIPNLKSVISYYNKDKKVLLASRIVDPETEFGVIEAWLAQYAKLRKWGNKEQRKKQDDALNDYKTKPQEVQEDIEKLLFKQNRRFIVLQGAPGTGKTFNAIKFSNEHKDIYAKTHFIQFHAETTYSEFVEGIIPNLTQKSQLVYERKDGILLNAIKDAKEIDSNSNMRVLLIIDEINRANLANVLGPVFYLFEEHADNRDVDIKVGDLKLTKLPKNLDVIATMNTADRSLAVVDFALRRRFRWYTIRPQVIKPGKGYYFHEDLFNSFTEIFNTYATDEELNLQPGPGYFITPDTNNKETIMRDRMIYELMPLIKEYLAEGLMKKATNSFAQLFYDETEKYLYE